MSDVLGFDPQKFIEDNKDIESKSAEDFDPDKFIVKNTEPKLSDEEYEKYKTTVGSEIPLLGAIPDYAGAATGALFSDKPFGEAFSEEMKKYEAARQQGYEREPIKSGAKALAGGAMLPQARFAKIPEGAGKMAQLLAYLTRGGKRAVETGLVTGADTLARTGESEKALETAKTGAKFGFGGEMVEPIVKGVGAFGRRFVAGVPESTAAKYKARPDAINAVDEDKLVADADEALNRVKNIRDEASEIASDAKEIYRNKVDDLKRADIPEDVADNVLTAIKDLRKDVKNQSSKAFEVLHNAGKTVPKEYIRKVFSNRINTLSIGGSVPSTSEAKVLRKYINFIDKMKRDELTFPEIKKFIQILDDDVDEAYAKLAMPGGRLNSGDRAILSARSAVNELLYDIPEYRAIMEPLAKKTELLKNIRDLMQSEKKAFRVLRNLDKPENIQERALVQRLDDETGTNVLGDLKNYETAKQISRDPNLRKLLPEYEDMIRAEKALGEAKQAYDEVGLSRGPIQSTIRRAGFEKAPNIDVKRKLGELSKYSDVDFVQSAEDLGVKRALDQGFLRGSRNVNLGAFSIGGLLGWIFKDVPGAQAVGQSIGSTIGGAADIVGPQTWKKFVDIMRTPQGQKAAEGLRNAVARGSRQTAIFIDTLTRKIDAPSQEDAVREKGYNSLKKEHEQSLRR